MTANKDLIIRLIRQDLKHNQLVVGLKELGFEDDGLHMLELHKIIADLMNIPEGKWDELLDTYFDFLEQSTDHRIDHDGKALTPLAEACYELLIARL